MGGWVALATQMFRSLQLHRSLFLRYHPAGSCNVHCLLTCFRVWGWAGSTRRPLRARQASLGAAKTIRFAIRAVPGLHWGGAFLVLRLQTGHCGFGNAFVAANHCDAFFYFQFHIVVLTFSHSKRWPTVCALYRPHRHLIPCAKLWRPCRAVFASVLVCM